MDLWEILLIALGLAMDAFAVSLSAGANRLTSGVRPTFRLSFHFGLFQFLMPVIGWFIGSSLQNYIEAVDHWIALALLSYIGYKMIKAGLSPDSEKKQNDPSKGANLMILSLATSIDALAVGFSLGLLRVNIWYPAFIIGIITAVLSLIGIKIGNRLGLKLGSRMEVIGGVVLIIIGLKILFEHTLV